MPKHERDPFEAAKEKFLATLAEDTSIPARQRLSAFKFAWYLTTLANRKIFKETGRLRAWPGLETAAKKLAMSKTTIIAVGRLLRDAGYLFIREGKAGRNTPNGYRMLLPNGTASALFNSTPAVLLEDDEIVHSDRLNSTAAVPEPLDITAEEDPPSEWEEGSYADAALPEAPDKDDIPF